MPPRPSGHPARRGALQHSVVLAAVSPLTVVLVVGALIVLLLVGVPWWVAVPAAVLVWLARVALSKRVVRAVSSRPARIDPFALREPWRFYVRDALQARARFSEATASANPGPVQDSLAAIGQRIEEAVHACWEVAQRGQHLHDAARRIDRRRVERELERLPDGEVGKVKRQALEVQLQTAGRLESQVADTRKRLELIDARLSEAVTRSIELAARTGSLESVQGLADAVDQVVIELEALRLGLDEAGGAPETT